MARIYRFSFKAIYFIFSSHLETMLLILLLLIHTVSITGTAEDIIEQVRNQLALSNTAEPDYMIRFLCTILPSPEFIKATNDQDLINSVVDELGFGTLGVRPNSWAARYQTDSNKRPSCFSAMYAIATSEISKTSVAGMKKLIRRCCLADGEL